MYFQEKKNMKLRAVQNDIIFMLQKARKRHYNIVGQR